jgi:hypothetical protein
MPKRHSERAYAPMCTPASGTPWFAISFIRHAQRDAREDFIKAVGGNNGRTWQALRAQGWRIVRVNVVAQ